MQQLIDRIMKVECVSADPPVLVDIGAAASLPAEWKLISQYSIGLAFDADTRDFQIEQTDKDGQWKQLFKINRLVLSPANESADFYLTQSPYCSSSLQPDIAALKPWLFRDLFAVKEKTSLPGVELENVLSDLNISRIDWYKSDTQGVDLRVFASLPESVIDSVLVAEFEPGIIDSYRGEDKLHEILRYMDQKPFWVSEMNLHGSHRIFADDLNSDFHPWLPQYLNTSPGWCEITYLNDMQKLLTNERAVLLGWIFATIKQQHGFALHLARQGRVNFANPLIGELLRYSEIQLTPPLWKRRFRSLKGKIRSLLKSNS